MKNSILALVLLPLASFALTPEEQDLLKIVDSRLSQEAPVFLEQTVNINSGTFNPEGVCKVADLYEERLKALGFKVSRADLKSVKRGCHILGEHLTEGKDDPTLLLLGHLDTVFEKDNSFQQFTRLENGDIKGPGISDMKGGNLVILEALEALKASGKLEKMNIKVAFTGDEESPGSDAEGSLNTTRKPLLDLARGADYALSFEGTRSAAEMVTGRRGIANWTLSISTNSGHSSRVYSKDLGEGAILPLARIVERFRKELKNEKDFTFNIGHIMGGTTVEPLSSFEGKLSGKANVIPAMAQTYGDSRFTSAEQLKRVRVIMKRIVDDEVVQYKKRYPAGAKIEAKITFNDRYPSMTPIRGNQDLLRQVSRISEELNLGKIKAADMAGQGAADIAFVAGLVPASLDGLGPVGIGIHTNEELMPKGALEAATKRATIFIFRLAQNKKPALRPAQ